MFAELNPRTKEGTEKLPRDGKNKKLPCQKVRPELCRTNNKSTKSMSQSSRQRPLMINVAVTDLKLLRSDEVGSAHQHLLCSNPTFFLLYI